MADDRSRVVETRTGRLGDIRPHPQNPRVHNDEQRVVLGASIQELGWTTIVYVYDDPEWGETLLDGHLRQQQFPDAEVTKVVLDLDREEASKFLLVHDPLAALAPVDHDLVAQLTATMQTSSAELEAFFKSMLPGESTDPNYSRKVQSPVYEITGKKPKIDELFDGTKTQALLEAITAADLPPDVKIFLGQAAHRHTRFDFAKIAEFYAHASPEIQRLMEDSALVIIDFDRAIELGFVKLSKRLSDIADEDDDEG